MIRKVTDELQFFLCQTASWQMVVLAEDELSAASASVEKASSEKKEFSALMIVKKMPQDLTNEVSEDKIFFLPMILADIGFHNEAKKLLDFFNNSKNEE